MIFRKAEIVRDVRVALDMNYRRDSLIAEGDEETLLLDEIIVSKIEEAARAVELEAPAHLLEEGHTFGETVYWDAGECGHIFLPDDFMRLLTFRMSDWERTLYDAITPEDPLYGLQSSRYKGIRGNPQKPVAAIVNRPEGKALEFYSCRSREAEVERATYLPYPAFDRAGGIDISARLYRDVVEATAQLVKEVVGSRE